MTNNQIDDHPRLIMSDRVLIALHPVTGQEIFRVTGDGGLHILSDKFEMDKPGANDYILRVGTGLPSDVRGRLEIRNQHAHVVAGDLGNLPKKAGILVLYDKNEDEHFLWVDTNGNLRIGDSDPNEADESGAIVGR